MNRRTLLAITAAAGAVLAGSPGLAQDEDITLRMSWWGNDARHALYNGLLDLYEEQNPNITVEREFSGWDGYWTKLSTQAAGGNLPDLIVQHLSYINEYADRGALLPLDDMVEAGTLDLGDFSQGALNAGMVDDTLYMVTLGLTPRGLIYNPRLFEEAGVEPPTEDMTWEEFADKAAAINTALGDGVFGATDQGMDGLPFTIFLGQRGKAMYDGEGLGFDEDDLRDYWGLWQGMRDEGALPSADLVSDMASTNDVHADSALAKGNLAMWIAPGNQFPLFQNYAEDELELTTLPRSSEEGAQPFNFAGGAFMSIAQNSEHPEEVARLINWFVNDPEAGRIYAGEHGPPGSRAIGAMLAENLAPADAKLYAFSDRVSDYMRPQAQSIPQSSEIEGAFGRIYDELRFGQITLDEAVERFFEEVEFILG
ncbi:ABC transporter substrate-binding protein [Wenxinia marina]|uniref:ABC-type sugar transport system, periplasmic component n=1 Tax=Wenxinia marina DSM 24838 TaxID=1123501 RepID=A0A0D0Q0I6_9RHOB|nr:sugar ABC transporter substrate-binding protein [Wenxinia marina]KIQ68084.1 ABC-type sugar transport system, periplasmic component [Wenxinia marina DSM 24838]GGL78073.1 sugar ABC transporter substrate-binding protein [Wenxinia marina]